MTIPRENAVALYRALESRVHGISQTFGAEIQPYYTDIEALERSKANGPKPAPVDPATDQQAHTRLFMAHWLPSLEDLSMAPGKIFKGIPKNTGTYSQTIRVGSADEEGVVVYTVRARRLVSRDRFAELSRRSNETLPLSGAQELNQWLARYVIRESSSSHLVRSGLADENVAQALVHSPQRYALFGKVTVEDHRGKREEKYTIPIWAIPGADVKTLMPWEEKHTDAFEMIPVPILKYTGLKFDLFEKRISPDKAFPQKK
jgi:hypothetical protein